MKRRKKIQFRNKIPKHHQVPEGTKLPGLMALFQEAGFIDSEGKETEEGKKALKELG